jgi:hypothetical protein
MADHDLHQETLSKVMCAAHFYIELGGQSDGSHRNKGEACDARGVVIHSFCCV